MNGCCYLVFNLDNNNPDIVITKAFLFYFILCFLALFKISPTYYFNSCIFFLLSKEKKTIKYETDKQQGRWVYYHGGGGGGFPSVKGAG